MLKIKSPLLLLVLVTLCRIAAAETNFVPPEHIDLTKILAPAPALGSDQEKRDLAEILAIGLCTSLKLRQLVDFPRAAGLAGFAWQEQG
jgi:hypothetical protein